MDDRAAAEQVKQMAQFILNEAREKFDEIMKKGMEEYNVEHSKIKNAEMEKVRQDYVKKVKAIDTQFAIRKSLAINKQRLDKVKARQDVLARISDEVGDKVYKEMQQQGPQLIVQLIAQGLLMLLEPNVVIRCRECDAKMVTGCFDQAAAEYSRVIKAETGQNKSVKITLDQNEFLAPAPEPRRDGPSCLGGVLLHCQNGKIVIDNTIDTRLKLLMEQDKPEIRRRLFAIN